MDDIYNALSDEVIRLQQSGVRLLHERDALKVERDDYRARKDEAYEERNRVVAALSKLWPSHLAQHPEDDATWERDWMTIVCIHSPVGQLTWHMHDSQRHLFQHLGMDAGHWDGHTTEEKYQRLDSLPLTAGDTARAALREALEQMTNAGEMLWVVIANVSGSDWSLTQTKEWRDAAGRWRDNYWKVVDETKPLLASSPPERTT